MATARGRAPAWREFLGNSGHPAAIPRRAHGIGLRRTGSGIAAARNFADGNTERHRRSDRRLARPRRALRGAVRCEHPGAEPAQGIELDHTVCAGASPDQATLTRGSPVGEHRTYGSRRIDSGGTVVAERVGLVVSGAGARGAYEAGAIAALWPQIAKHDPPPILIGTSAGAVNVVGLAGFAHLEPRKAAAELVARWGSMTLDDVFSPVRSILGSALVSAGQFLGLGSRLPSLLDTGRMRATLQHRLPWGQLHEKIRTGTIGAVAVAATSVATRGTVVFVEKHPSVPLPPTDQDRNITYVDTEIGVDHVLASAAVPALFRAIEVQVQEPNAAWSGWYVDGGLLLNTPLKPAVAFGVDVLGVVSTHPNEWTTKPPSEQTTHTRPPDVFAASALALRAMLGDRMIEDLKELEHRNQFARQGLTNPRGKPYRLLDVWFAGPPLEQSGAIADLAARVFDERFGGLQGIRHPVQLSLSKLIGGEAADAGDLLSYLFFDPEFARKAAELGRCDAKESIAARHRGEA